MVRNQLRGGLDPSLPPLLGCLALDTRKSQSPGFATLRATLSKARATFLADGTLPPPRLAKYATARVPAWRGSPGCGGAMLWATFWRLCARDLCPRLPESAAVDVAKGMQSVGAALLIQRSPGHSWVIIQPAELLGKVIGPILCGAIDSVEYSGEIQKAARILTLSEIVNVANDAGFIIEPDSLAQLLQDMDICTELVPPGSQRRFIFPGSLSSTNAALSRSNMHGSTGSILGSPSNRRKGGDADDFNEDQGPLGTTSFMSLFSLSARAEGWSVAGRRLLCAGPLLAPGAFAMVQAAVLRRYNGEGASVEDACTLRAYLSGLHVLVQATEGHGSNAGAGNTAGPSSAGGYTGGYTDGAGTPGSAPGHASPNISLNAVETMTSSMSTTDLMAAPAAEASGTPQPAPLGRCFVDIAVAASDPTLLASEIHAVLYCVKSTLALFPRLAPEIHTISVSSLTDGVNSPEELICSALASPEMENPLPGAGVSGSNPFAFAPTPPPPPPTSSSSNNIPAAALLRKTSKRRGAANNPFADNVDETSTTRNDNVSSKQDVNGNEGAGASLESVKTDSKNIESAGESIEKVEDTSESVHSIESVSESQAPIIYDAAFLSDASIVCAPSLKNIVYRYSRFEVLAHSPSDVVISALDMPPTSNSTSTQASISEGTPNSNTQTSAVIAETENNSSQVQSDATSTTTQTRALAQISSIPETSSLVGGGIDATAAGAFPLVGSVIVSVSRVPWDTTSHRSANMNTSPNTASGEEEDFMTYDQVISALDPKNAVFPVFIQIARAPPAAVAHAAYMKEEQDRASAGSGPRNKPPAVVPPLPPPPAYRMCHVIVGTTRGVERLDGDMFFGSEPLKKDAHVLSVVDRKNSDFGEDRPKACPDGIQWAVACVSYPISSEPLGSDMYSDSATYSMCGLYLVTREQALGLVASHPAKQALVYVHGFNNSFSYAARSTALVGRAVEMPLTVMLSWPSDPSAAGKGWIIEKLMTSYERRYTRCEANMHAAVRPFISAALALSAIGKPVAWNAHSMGCYLLLNMADRILWTQAGGSSKDLGSSQYPVLWRVVLCAPDVPAWFFSATITAAAECGSHFCHYYNDKDQATEASRKRRAMDGPCPGNAAVIQCQGLTTVDCTDGRSSTFLNHDYGQRDGNCLLDQRDFLAGEDPSQRCLTFLGGNLGWKLLTQATPKPPTHGRKKT